MRSRTFLSATSLVAAILLVLTLALPTAAADTSKGSTATVARAVTTWLSTASASDRLPVIVSFKSDDGVAKLNNLLGSKAERLASVPMAYAPLTAAQIRTVTTWPETRSVSEQPRLQAARRRRQRT